METVIAAGRFGKESYATPPPYVMPGGIAIILLIWACLRIQIAIRRKRECKRTPDAV